MDKTQRSAVYRAFLSREGPQNLGSQQWPEPKKGALKGVKFLVTGVLETIERNDLIGIITSSSGHVMSTLSKKLDILVVGRDAGPTKLQKAEEWELNQMSEYEFYNYLTEKLNSFDPEAEPEPKPEVKKKPTPRKSKGKTGEEKEPTPKKKSKKQ